MIFVTLGNQPIQFTRLAMAVDEIAPRLRESVFVQYGATIFKFKNVASKQFLAYTEMIERIEQSSIVVCHGGWGTISECLKLGKPIVAVPRRCGTESNHPQDELVRALETLGYVLGVYECEELLETIERARYYEFKPVKRGDASRIINNFLLRTQQEKS